MPSWTRAPPESLMKTNGEPVFRDCSMISAILIEWTSPAEPPATVKSWLARCTSRPSTAAHPVTTPSAGKSLPAMPNSVARCWANSPDSSKLPGSTSASTRSRARQLAVLVLLLDAVRAAAEHQRGSLLFQVPDLRCHGHSGSPTAQGIPV